MRPWPVLVLVLLAGCAEPSQDEPVAFDAAPDTPDADPDADPTPDADAEDPDARPPAADAQAPREPRVVELSGGWLLEADQVALSGIVKAEFEVPEDATWIIEIVWDTNPTNEELHHTVWTEDDPVDLTGTSPLRKEFSTDAPTGDLAFSTDGNYAYETYTTAYVSIFDGVPFDEEWSALPDA